MAGPPALGGAAGVEAPEGEEMVGEGPDELLPEAEGGALASVAVGVAAGAVFVQLLASTVTRAVGVTVQV